MIEFVAHEDEIGERIDVILARRAAITRTLAQRALKDGAVTVGGAAVRPSYRIEAGDTVAGTIPDVTLAPPQAEDIPIAIRHADDRVLVVSKPAGLVTHPARGHAGGTLVNALLALGVPLSGAASTRPGIVHRLDKDTSGLLLVAKDDDAHAFLLDALRSRAIKRTYLALVRGRPSSPTGTIDAPVARHPSRRTLMAVVPGGRSAVTHYELLGSGDKVSLLRIDLDTGRTHQIRVHLSHLGHPVVGDRTYGGGGDVPRALGLARPFLHAWKLDFPHPDGGGLVAVTDPLPGDLRQALVRAEIGLPAGA